MLIRSDARHIPLKSGIVQCCVTSPPYWGLRKYGDIEMQTLWGSMSDFRLPRKHHERWWARIRWRALSNGGVFSLTKDSWIGALGLEPTPDLYVNHIVAVMREVWRVMRDDGVLFLNLGDSYSSGGRGTNHHHRQKMGSGTAAAQALGRKLAPGGLGNKEMVGIPWRVAFALQADGWYLRSDIIWSKPNPMPESVTDRPTKAHEYIFLLTKSERYFWDQEAVKEEAIYAGPNAPDKIKSPYGQGFTRRSTHMDGTSRRDGDRWRMVDGGVAPRGGGRNIRSVWTIATQPYSGAHYATFPRKLVETCISAGTSEKGCCSKCGSPWERILKRTPNPSKQFNVGLDMSGGTAKTSNPQTSKGLHRNGGNAQGPQPLTIGWQPTCHCDSGEPVPCIVFDPFCGSGTVQMVACDLGRIGIGSDLAYHDLSRTRIYGPLFAKTINRGGPSGRVPGAVIAGRSLFDLTEGEK